MNYGFIGLGNMGSAIIRGMVNSNSFTSDSIYGYNRSIGKTNILSKECGLIPCNDILDLIEKCDVILLCVKPQMMEEVLKSFNVNISEKLIITIAAGKNIQWYENIISTDASIIRVMPNLNATVGMSLSALCCNSHTSDDQILLAKSIFESVGFVYEINEEMFSAFSAVCGASGAFVYLYIDSLAEAAVKAGFPRKMAEELAVGTVLGSTLLEQKTGEHPIVLMNKICSPAGTTIEGVMKLKELGFETAVQQGIEAIINKDNRI